MGMALQWEKEMLGSFTYSTTVALSSHLFLGIQNPFVTNQDEGLWRSSKKWDFEMNLPQKNPSLSLLLYSVPGFMMGMKTLSNHKFLLSTFYHME